MPLLFDLIYVVLFFLYSPYLFYQMGVLKKNRRGWRQRFGNIPERAGSRPCVWIHAVSLGEVNATRTLVFEIRRRLPDYDIVLSATTDTGYTAAKKLYSDLIVFRYPLDFSIVIARVMRRIRPSAIILMELEVWPNLLTMARSRSIPVGIANGRVTEEKSMRRFRKPILRTLARGMFSKIAWVGAQEDIYAARFHELGVPLNRIHVTGSMKYDTSLNEESGLNENELAGAMNIRRNAPLIVAGSTGPGEEEMLLAALAPLRADRPDVQLAIIPRKPERFDEVALLIERNGYACKRRSTNTVTMGTNANSIVYLGDTMGELRKFYALADIVFVGRTLVPLGGSDLMEVAALARPMCFGPYVDNFADVAQKLLAADAARRINTPEDLATTLRQLLDDPLTAEGMGCRAQEIVRQNTGATRKTVELLCQVLISR